MKTYHLKANEIVYYQGPVTLKTAKGETPAEVILTNLNFIFVTEREKRWWRKQTTRSVVFSKERVKMDGETPQIKMKDTTVTAYFTKEDRIFTFENKKEARIFVIKSWKMVTGKNLLERNLDKLKYALDAINDKFDVDVIALIKDVALAAVASKIGKFLNLKK